MEKSFEVERNLSNIYATKIDKSFINRHISVIKIVTYITFQFNK